MENRWATLNQLIMCVPVEQNPQLLSKVFPLLEVKLTHHYSVHRPVYKFYTAVAETRKPRVG